MQFLAFLHKLFGELPTVSLQFPSPISLCAFLNSSFLDDCKTLVRQWQEWRHRWQALFLFVFTRIRTQGTHNVSAHDGLLTVNISYFSHKFSLTTQIAYKCTSLLIKHRCKHSPITCTFSATPFPIQSWCLTCPGCHNDMLIFVVRNTTHAVMLDIKKKQQQQQQKKTSWQENSLKEMRTYGILNF